ncbi:MAG: hypothetical protein HDQ88_00885 [Clostridia bacterium]|nr:hypothetical protein [Clostridia bacterium]
MLLYVRDILDDNNKVVEAILNSFREGFADAGMRNEMVLNIKDYFAGFKENLLVYVETSYIDKVYRNLYSHFLTTKLKIYGMYCIRLLLFSDEMDFQGMYEDKDFCDKLKKNYLGFVVIRPISPGTIGRSVVNPVALRLETEIQISTVSIRTSALGYKIHALGFPHSSQDRQYMTCAETSIWTIMEYYGCKYVDYIPILPSIIHKCIERNKYERDVPSSGLDITFISSVLKARGFGCMIYSNSQASQYDRPDMSFYRIFSCYVESGIPFITSIMDEENGFYHAVVCVGEEHKLRSEVDKIKATYISYDIEVDDSGYYHWGDLERRFVFNDDNSSPYSIGSFNNPNPNDRSIFPIIDSIIVPLHKKIYMDAPRALEISELIVAEILEVPAEYVIRTILVSTNSYLNHISSDPVLKRAFKDLLIGVMRFPKFLWVTEIASKEKFRKDRVEGLLLLDATETMKENPDLSVNFAYFGNFLMYFDVEEQIIKEINLTLQFEMTTYRNLQKFG